MLDNLPASLQHLVLLEWLSPESVCAVARAGSTSLRKAVLSSPLPFSAGKMIVVDPVVRWFKLRGVPLRLWVKVVSYHNCERWFCNGEIHRDDDLPAVVYNTGLKYWYQNGKVHREDDRPAVVNKDGHQAWYHNGVRHRDDDRPAAVFPGRFMEWWKHGELHRDGDRPAIIWADGLQHQLDWWKHGRRCRDGGKPACVIGDGAPDWILYGKIV